MTESLSMGLHAQCPGEYGYARWTLQRLERLIDGEYDESAFPMTFSGRSEAVDFEDIIENLRTPMDIAFRSVMGLQVYDDDDEDYQRARELFINEDGIPYGAVMYGLFLNLWFSNVFSIHPSTKHSEGALLENVEIHGLQHKMVEYLRLDKVMTAPYKNPFNAALDARALLGDQVMFYKVVTMLRCA